MELLHYAASTSFAAGATVVAHGLPQAPDRVWFDAGGKSVSVSYDATNITVTNNTAAAVTVKLWAEVLHSTVRSLGGKDQTDPPVSGVQFAFAAALGGGGPAPSVQTISADTTLDDSAEVVVVTGASGNVTVTLPSAATAEHAVVVKDGDGAATAANIIIQRAGSDTIDGQTSITIEVDYGSFTLVPDGASAWYVI